MSKIIDRSCFVVGIWNPRWNSTETKLSPGMYALIKAHAETVQSYLNTIGKYHYHELHVSSYAWVRAQ